MKTTKGVNCSIAHRRSNNEHIPSAFLSDSSESGPCDVSTLFKAQPLVPLPHSVEVRLAKRN